MAINMTDPWLKGVRARVAGESRAAIPYAQNKIEIGSSELVAATQWFSGWDTADIILGFHNAKEPV